MIAKQNLNENRASHLLSSAQTCYKNGEYNETLKLCKSAYDSDPFRTDNLIMLAAVHFQLKNYDESVFYCKQCIQVDPDFAEAYNNLGKN